ncbi:axonemal dynein light chain domain-containing protein 1-like [Haliotis cracherodii]|uniref:axonemal dynein light chain domain-containing protein 1-like n=1 Tax=Haliotis cracherodii TaxID=6455 RepID=UPI0039E93BAA
MSATVAPAAMDPQMPMPTPPLMDRSAGMEGSGTMVPADSNQSVLPNLRSSTSVDKTKPLPTSLQSDFLPEDVLFALTQAPVLKDQLGPPSRHRNLNTSSVQGRQRPANVWHFQRRDRFKHLTENTACTCGAGRDISFLYDVPQTKATAERPEKIDKSIVRRDTEEKPRQALQLPDTLLPDEYHIVKNKGVLGIEYHEDKYSTQPDDHEKHLVKFPSLKPASRYEVLQLKRSLEDMLEKAGVADNDVVVKGPTQMHNLLELIKKEQNVYNIIFHELIRQVSVECVERGELLAMLRDKYSALLNKVPQQIKSLHEEVMAQRALDRRLTEELMRFKSTISVLTNELTDVKEHDQRVTREAQKAQEDLKTALGDAQKNASLLAEYHDLYELQRRRLERQVFMLSDERELWSTAAYSLALKVTEECRLTTAKRMHVSEKAWAKLANHFTVLLSDKDTEQLTEIQGHVEVWRDQIEDFNIALKQREEEMREHLRGIRAGVEHWVLDFQKNCFNAEGNMVKIPDKKKMISLRDDIQAWEENLSKEAEVFAGDLLLSNEDELIHIRKEMDGWTDSALKVFGRHSGLDGRSHQEQDNMIVLNDEVEELLKQFTNRISGENGVATSVIHLTNAIELWETRLTSALNGTMTLQETDWSSFYHTLDDWVVAVDQCLEYVGTTQKQEDKQEGREHTSIDIHDTVRKTQKWATTASNTIDSEDAKLVEQVSTLHAEMVQWMVQMLLRLAPDKEGNSVEAGEMVLLGSSSIPLLHENAKSLFERLQKFSNYVTLCCDGIVLDNTLQRQDNMEEHADQELRDLRRLRGECEDWTHTAKILTSQLTGETVEELFPRLGPSDSQSKTQVSSVRPEGYHDKEPLEPPQEPQEPPEQQQQQQPPPEAPTPQKQEETTPAPTPTPAEGSTGQTSEQTAGQTEEQTAGQTEEQTEEQTTDKRVEQTTVEETAEETADAEKTKEQEQEQNQPAPVEDAGEKLELIGTDDNTHVEGLHSDVQAAPETQTASKSGTPDTKRAFEALAAVGNLQSQLLDTEQRAQEAEERAASAEIELTVVKEQLRALEKKMTQLTGRDQEETTPISLTTPSSISTHTPTSSRTPATTPVVRRAEKKEEKKLPVPHSPQKKSSAKGKKK